jgi:hypothetical protein
VRTYALYLLASVFVISSCKPQHIITTQRDTVIITQSVSVVDTLLLQDTITVIKDRLRIHIQRLPGDTVVVTGECAPDTVTVRQTILKTDQKLVNRQKNWIGSLFMIALLLFIIVLLKK